MQIRLVEARWDRTINSCAPRIKWIKLVREITGLGLRESKNIVDDVVDGTPRNIDAVTMDVDSGIAALRAIDMEAVPGYEAALRDGLMMALEAAIGTGRNNDAMVLFQMLKAA